MQCLYFGGGTPGLVPATEIGRLVQAISQQQAISQKAEITLEVNPHQTASPIAAYREAGVNRLSIGIQSLDDGELKALSRSHTAHEAVDFVKTCQQAGCENISIDLMYGLPERGQAVDNASAIQKRWRQTLAKVVDLGVPHVSMYGLKVEAGTPLDRLTTMGAYQLPDDSLTLDLYDEAVETLVAAGLRRYEFSNFAKPGFESQHNLNYWRYGSWAGFGLGAFGEVIDTHGKRWRTQNTRDFECYCQSPMTHQQREPVSQKEALENCLIFGLRLADGISLMALSQRFGVDVARLFEPTIRQHATALDYQPETGRLRMRPEAIGISNEILCDFLLDEDPFAQAVSFAA